VGFRFPYVIGQFILCLPKNTLYFALVLLAAEAVVFKPNISR